MKHYSYLHDEEAQWQMKWIDFVGGAGATVASYRTTSPNRRRAGHVGHDLSRASSTKSLSSSADGHAAKNRDCDEPIPSNPRRRPLPTGRGRWNLCQYTADGLWINRVKWGRGLSGAECITRCILRALDAEALQCGHG